MRKNEQTAAIRGLTQGELDHVTGGFGFGGFGGFRSIAGTNATTTTTVDSGLQHEPVHGQ